LHEVVGMVLRDLPRDLMRSQDPSAPVEKSTGVATTTASAVLSPVAPTITPEPAVVSEPIIDSEPVTVAETAPPPATPAPVAPVAAQVSQESAPPPSAPPRSASLDRTTTDPVAATAEMSPELLSEEGRANFVAFCRQTNPLGDMRRVVVAAEGASRHFGLDGVNADDLADLFDMAGWRRPGNFTQTLRNAARSKFGWLERIPGRSGRYAATPLGLSKTVDS